MAHESPQLEKNRHRGWAWLILQIFIACALIFNIFLTATANRKPAIENSQASSPQPAVPEYGPGDMQVRFLLVPTQKGKWTDGVLDEIKNPRWIPERGDTWGSSKGRAVVLRRHIKKMGDVYVMNVWCRVLRADEWQATVEGKFSKDGP